LISASRIEADGKRSAARFEDAKALLEEALAIAEVMERVDAQDAIDGSAGKRERLGAAANERGAAAPRARSSRAIDRGRRSSGRDSRPL
jgi:hypothetical protein